MQNQSVLAAVIFCMYVTGCTTERIIERPVPIQPPSLCLEPCPYPVKTPETNGDLLENWQDLRQALACYEARLACIREMVGR